jgi:hypothetical protein
LSNRLRILRIVLEYLARDAVFSILILMLLAFLPHQVYPFPAGYDSTTDPTLVGFPLAYYCWCSVLNPDSSMSMTQFYLFPLVADFLFWMAVVFALDFTYTDGYSEIHRARHIA